MNLRSLLGLMAAYHGWAYGRLFDAVDRMAESDYRHDFGLFFRSVHGTLNHLLVVEHLWRERLEGVVATATRLDQELVHERGALREALMEFAGRWPGFVAEVPEPALGDALAYRNLQGIDLTLPRAPLILHVFNHATHHRGQISAVLTRLGFPAPEMDLPYFLLERPAAVASG